jgi:hypothetical protein
MGPIERAIIYIYQQPLNTITLLMNFLDSIDILTGDGFSLRNGKVITKYTYGVSLLQFPFYLTADILTAL